MFQEPGQQMMQENNQTENIKTEKSNNANDGQANYNGED